MRMRIVLVVLIGLLALPVAQLGSPVEAKRRPRTVTRTFSFLPPIEQIAMVATSPVSAVPYPAALMVSGLKGKIRDVNLRLNGLSHGQPGDLEVLLVGPDGQTAIVMADVGTTTVEDVTLLLDDEAAAPLPAGTLQSGAFRPTNASGAAIAFNAPAPTGVGANAALSVFDGTNPNGIWHLFVQADPGPTGIGYFRDGWDLELKVKTKQKRR